MSRFLHNASWILLTLVAAATLLGSFFSASLAYRGGTDLIGDRRTTVDDVGAWRPDVATAIRGRRGTAAAFAAAYATLLLLIVVVPYRRGEVWSWWAILAASIVLAAFVLARVPLLGTRRGAGLGSTQLGVIFVALLLDVGRLRRAARP